MASRYKVSSKVWMWPGDAAWHFANVDTKQSAAITAKHGKAKRGFGSVPVEATLGKSTWKTSIFPDRRSGTYLLPLKRSVRMHENIEAGDTVSFTLRIG